MNYAFCIALSVFLVVDLLIATVSKSLCELSIKSKEQLIESQDRLIKAQYQYINVLEEQLGLFREVSENNENSTEEDTSQVLRISPIRREEL